MFITNPPPRHFPQTSTSTYRCHLIDLNTARLPSWAGMERSGTEAPGEVRRCLRRGWAAPLPRQRRTLAVRADGCAASPGGAVRNSRKKTARPWAKKVKDRWREPSDSIRACAAMTGAATLPALAARMLGIARTSSLLSRIQSVTSWGAFCRCSSFFGHQAFPRIQRLR